MHTQAMDSTGIDRRQNQKHVQNHTLNHAHAIRLNEASLTLSLCLSVHELYDHPKDLRCESGRVGPHILQDPRRNVKSQICHDLLLAVTSTD
jgi:hypothetical protein